MPPLAAHQDIEDSKMKSFNYARAVQASLIGIAINGSFTAPRAAVIRWVGVTGLAAVGATTAMLWLSPAAAGEQTMPGATVESVVAIAKRLNPTVAAASLEFDAAVHKIGTAGVLADPTLILEAWDVNRQGVGQRRIGIDQEIKLWGKYGLERDIAQSDADAAKFQGRATVTELIAQVIAAHGEYNAAYEAVAISTDIKRPYDEILGLFRSR